MEALLEVEQRMDAIKAGKIEAFDKLNKLQEQLQGDIESLIEPLGVGDSPNLQNEIKQVEQDEEEVIEELNRL